jgi:hypothetical protein
MMGFEAEGAAPIVRGDAIEAPQTIASAIRIGNPASWEAATKARDDSGGEIGMVSDAEILSAYRLMAETEGIFCEPASAAGVAGLIVPDLPVEEAANLGAICRAADLSLIQLVTPTTPRERAVRIAATSITLVSVAGITEHRTARRFAVSVGGSHPDRSADLHRLWHQPARASGCWPRSPTADRRLGRVRRVAKPRRPPRCSPGSATTWPIAGALEGSWSRA